MNSAEIEIFNESTTATPEINQQELELILKLIYADHENTFDWLNIILFDDQDHKDMNIKYLNHDYSTDIITFEFEENNKMNGEIYINHEQMIRNALEYKASIKNEFYRLIIHGALHLNGYKDHSAEEKVVMTSKENHYLHLVKD